MTDELPAGYAQFERCIPYSSRPPVKNDPLLIYAYQAGMKAQKVIDARIVSGLYMPENRNGWSWADIAAKAIREQPE